MKDKQLASQVYASADSRIGPEPVLYFGDAAAGRGSRRPEKAIDDEIAAVVKDGVTPEEFAKAKTQLLRSFIEQRRSSLTTAQADRRYAVYFGDPNLINTVSTKKMP